MHLLCREYYSEVFTKSLSRDSQGTCACKQDTYSVVYFVPLGRPFHYSALVTEVATFTGLVCTIRTVTGTDLLTCLWWSVSCRWAASLICACGVFVAKYLLRCIYQGHSSRRSDLEPPERKCGRCDITRTLCAQFSQKPSQTDLSFVKNRVTKLNPDAPTQAPSKQRRYQQIKKL